MDIFYLGLLREKFSLYIKSKIDAPIEHIILITTIISSIPFGLLNYYIHNRNLRLLYSLIIGFIWQYSIYGINTFHTVFSTLSTYLFVYYFGRKKSPFYVLVGTMIHLSYINIKRMIEDYGNWSIDSVSTIYMMTLAKYTDFAFSYDDGKLDPKTIRSEHHKMYLIKEMPTFLEYASYIYFYPTSVIGPFCKYIDFINFIDEKECYKDLKTKKKYLFKKGLENILLALFFIAFYSTIGAWFPMSDVGKPKFRLDYPEWWKRILFMYAAGTGIRSKYYIGWLLSYSSLIFSGMAYGETKKDEKIIPNVEKGSYGSIIFNEFGMHPKLKMVHWNRQIHLWLKYNIYIRLLNPLNGNKSLATFITYIVSSIWHGFYPTYYINFILIYLFEQDSLFLDELGFYKFVDEHSFIWPFISLKTSFFNDSVGSFFYCLETSSVKQILINYYGLPANVTIGFFIFTLLYKIIFKKKRKKASVKEIEKEGKKLINNKKIE